MRTFVATVLVLAFLASACGGGATTSTGTTVTVTQDDKKIALDQVTVPSGVVTFKLLNKGTIVHSLYLLRTDLPHDQIPVDPSDAAKVKLDGVVREIGQMKAGETKEISAKLAAGSYVFVCNEPAHYAVGMHIGFVVK